MKPTPPELRARRGGSVLVLVLAVTSIVGVIGLSSLMAVRLQHRDVDARSDATQAALLADGALRLVHSQLHANDNWRAEHTHGVWTDDTELASGALRYKLEDEGDDRDADLADSDEDAARLTVRVAVDDAVRLSSIRLAGQSVDSEPPPVVRGSYRRELDR